MRRDADVDDGRGVRVTLTKRGETLVQDTLLALDELEARFLEILGARRLRDLLRVAEDLNATLSAENDTLDAVLAGGPSEVGEIGEQSLRSVAARLRRRLGGEASARLAALLLEADEATRGAAAPTAGPPTGH